MNPEKSSMDLWICHKFDGRKSSHPCNLFQFCNLRVKSGILQNRPRCRMLFPTARALRPAPRPAGNVKGKGSADYAKDPDRP